MNPTFFVFLAGTISFSIWILGSPMKLHRSVVWLAIILFGMILSGQAYSADPGGDLLSGKRAKGKRVKIISTDIIKNRAAGTWDTSVTLRNVTSPKQTLYGPFTLVVTKISRARVTLSNASGVTASGQPYLTFFLPPEGLAPKKAIKRVLLNFRNPSRKRFDVKYALYGYLTPPKPNESLPACEETATAPAGPITVKSVFPGRGPTGTVITINGNGFSACSRVFLGEIEITGPRYLSEKQLEIVVPFGLDANRRLIALAAGNYPIKVETSSLIDFSVTGLDLPHNPNPPGQVLNDETKRLFDVFKQLQPRFEVLLPELLADAKDNIEEQKFWENLNELNRYILANSEATVQNLLTELDAQSLDMMERLLISQRVVPVSPLIRSLSASPSVRTTDAAQTAGDQWLQERANYVEGEFAQTAALVSTFTGWCSTVSKLPLLVTVDRKILALRATCLLVSVNANLVQMIIEAEVAKKYGLIKNMQLHVSHEMAKETHSLVINNGDNNEFNPTGNARNVTGATIEATLKSAKAAGFLSLYKIAQDLSGLFDSPSYWSDIVDQIKAILTAIIATKIDASLQTTDGLRVISVSNLGWKLSDWLGIIPDIESDNCSIAASTDEWYLRDRGDGIFAVPDAGPVLTYPTQVGQCTYKILKKLRMPSEDGVSSQIQFSIQKWYKATISVGPGGRVIYPYPVPSGRNACEEGQICLDYFYTLDPLLEARPKNSSTTAEFKWGNTNCLDGESSCRLQLDPTNRQPPGVTVTFTFSDPTGTWCAVLTKDSTPPLTGLGCTVDAGSERRLCLTFDANKTVTWVTTNTGLIPDSCNGTTSMSGKNWELGGRNVNFDLEGLESQATYDPTKFPPLILWNGVSYTRP